MRWLIAILLALALAAESRACWLFGPRVIIVQPPIVQPYAVPVAPYAVPVVPALPPPMLYQPPAIVAPLYQPDYYQPVRYRLPRRIIR
jgi:hypothetical protein